MKTATIDLLKKDLLIVELPRKSDVEVFPNSIEIYNQFTGQEETIKGSYTLLGKPDEIKEEDVSEFVEQSIFTSLYGHYVSGIDVNTYCYKNALESFNSALESEIYWENPWGDRMPIFVEASPSAFKFVEKEKERWKEAQEKTFDKNRTLIFVKN